MSSLPPFMKARLQTGLMVQKRKPDGVEPSEDQGDSALQAAAEDMIRAFEAKDGTHLALALRAAYDILCSEERAEESLESEGQE